MADLDELKQWSEMTRKERLEAIDEINSGLKDLEASMREDLQRVFDRLGAPLELHVVLQVSVTDNLQDPRLPDQPGVQCSHKHWDFTKHGRHCTCGALMIDPGD